MVPITIVNGVYKPSYNWGAPPCRNVIIFPMQRGQFWGILKYTSGTNPPKMGHHSLSGKLFAPYESPGFHLKNSQPRENAVLCCLYVISRSSLYCYDHYYHHPWTRSSISLSSKITTVNVIIITITIAITTTTTTSIIIIIIIIIISIFIVFVLVWLYIICLGIVMLFFMIGRHIYVSLLSLGLPHSSG